MKIKKGMQWGELSGDDIQELYNQALPLLTCNGEEFTPGKQVICFYDTNLLINGEVLEDNDIYIELDAVFFKEV